MPDARRRCLGFTSVEDLLGQRHPGRLVATSAEMAAHILEQVEVVVVPGEAVGSPDRLRLSYVLGDSAMAEGPARLIGLFG